MALGEFTAEQITAHVTRIQDGLGAAEYLVQGSRRALLVDTGYGIFDLRNFVDGLAATPYDVVCTHGHLDHACGTGQFEDHDVYMSELDLGLYDEHADVAYRRSFLAGSFPELAAGLADADFVPKRTTPFLPLEDEQRFDLGDVHVRAIHTPGHTQGMMVLLVEEDRAALFGDACGVFTLTILPEATSVAVYRQSLAHLREFEDEWDIVLRQHGTCESPKSILSGNIELCDLILAREDDHQPVEFMGVQAYLAKATTADGTQRVDGGEGNIAYREDNIW